MAYQTKQQTAGQIKEEMATEVLNSLINNHERCNTEEWKKNWHLPAVLPLKASGGMYRGFNFLKLFSAGYGDERFFTFKNAKDMDTYIKKGEKGIPIMYAEIRKKNELNPATGQEEEIEYPIWKRYVVFNAQQLADLEKVDKVRPPIERKPFSSEMQIEQNEYFTALMMVADEMGIMIDHQKQDKAYYSPTADKIVMPPMESFQDYISYAGTLMHEMAHATGHKDRLNRLSVEKGKFGDEAYAIEEITAECTSLMLSARTGLKYDTSQHENHLAYLHSWGNRLKGIDEKSKKPSEEIKKEAAKMIMGAVSNAQKAFDYINEKVEAKLAQLQEKERTMSFSDTLSKEEKLEINVTNEINLKNEARQVMQDKLAVAMNEAPANDARSSSSMSR